MASRVAAQTRRGASTNGGGTAADYLYKFCGYKTVSLTRVTAGMTGIVATLVRP